MVEFLNLRELHSESSGLVFSLKKLTFPLTIIVICSYLEVVVLREACFKDNE